MSTVKFYRKIDQSIVAIKGNECFDIPSNSGFGEDDASQQTIADNFDSAPFKAEGTPDLTGAILIAEKTPATSA